MFKDQFLMGIFPLPALDTTHIVPINMIFSSIDGSLGSVDPWVLPHTKDMSTHLEHLSHQHILILVNNSILMWSVINLLHLYGLLTLSFLIIS
jgi:hypothetical protein